MVFEHKQKQVNWAYFLPPQVGVTACGEEAPGCGKTEITRQLASITGRHFFSYELSRTEPADLMGFPMVRKIEVRGQEYEVMRFVPDERLLRAELEPSIILIDELKNVIAPKQAPALNLIQNPPANCWMYAACNPIESSADGQDLTCPFINRIWFGQFEQENAAQDEGWVNRLQYPAPEFPVVPENYMDYQPKWGGIVRDFLRYKPQERHNCPTRDDEKIMPWPSPRQWHNLQKCLAAGDAVGANVETRNKLIMGLIGHNTGPMFIEYINNLSLPKPEELLASLKASSIPDRYDMAIAVLASVVNYVAQLPEDEQPAQLEAAYELYHVVREASAELATLYLAGLRHHFDKFVTDKQLAEITV